jgi:hypothetical protein
MELANQNSGAGFIHVRIISSKAGAGPETISGTPEEVLGVIKEHVTKKKKWFYKDGKMRANMESLTTQELSQAGDLTLTNEISGGERV